MSSSIKTFSIEQIYQLVSDIGIPSFRAGQILSWLYSKGVESYDEMTNIPAALREQFSTLYPINYPSIISKQVSSDGTIKFLIQFEDGACTETVGLPSEDGRLTVCISSQSGCSMGCSFCATGQAGFTRDLYPGEIVDQAMIVSREFDQRISNIVIMGQGEPFANYDNTLNALRIFNHPKLLNIGARHITVSTSGLADGIRSFGTIEEQFTLAVSLHSAVQSTRNMIMPRLRNQPLDELRIALTDYSSKSGRRFSFEYALMKDINDSKEELDALVSYCRGLLCHVNLIPLNAIENSPFQLVGMQIMEHWKDELSRSGIAVSIRKSRGADIDAACGQLAQRAKI